MQNSEEEYRNETWRNEQLSSLKRRLELFEEEPIDDEGLRLALKWIKELESGIIPECWEDYTTFKFEIDEKNWRYCECESGWQYNVMGQKIYKKHRHRIHRTLEQAISEL